MRISSETFAGKIKLLIILFFTSAVLRALASEISFPDPNEYPDDKALVLARRFHRAGCYEEAITEVKRFLFFHRKEKETVYAHTALADLYMLCCDWNEAEYHITLAINAAADSAAVIESRIKRVTIFIASGSYILAEKELTSLSPLAETETQKKRIAFFSAVADIYTGKWKHAKEMLGRYFEDNTHVSDDDKKKVNRLLDAAENQKEIPILAAAFLSALIPGSGQIYAGDFFHGIHAFILNASVMAVFVMNIVEGNYADAAMVFFFLLNRFYSGNIYHAKRIAGEKNVKNANNYKDIILHALAGDR
ncbi:MAG: hypothetical protein JW881_04750 [Spirochaetales bacterium]|nr:hypothetical protein [Spirochaetales bacterium]